MKPALQYICEVPIEDIKVIDVKARRIAGQSLTFTFLGRCESKDRVYFLVEIFGGVSGEMESDLNFLFNGGYE